VPLYTSVVLTEECNVTVKNEELIGATDQVTI
jgi:hypothetical protein